jgi:hypothetical protein
VITSDHPFTLLPWPSSLDIVIISLQGIFVNNNTRLMVIFAVYIVVIYKLDLLSHPPKAFQQKNLLWQFIPPAGGFQGLRTAHPVQTIKVTYQVISKNEA